MTAWTLPVLEIDPPKNPRILSDVLPLLVRLDAAFGTRPIAKLLDVGAGTVTNWKRRRHAISPEYAKRVIELHDVLVRALQVFQPQVAMDWLVGHEPYLDHARPIDVLVKHGAAPLIVALDGIESLGYA
jgi:uncharacterized protein (DUF2384 family)